MRDDNRKFIAQTEIQVSAIIHFDNPHEIAGRLHDMGLSEVPLREAIYQGHLQRTHLTNNHPIIFHGLNMWGWVVKELRDQLRPMGWVREDIGSYALTINDERKVAITVASGDEGTGDPSAHPSNRSRKGRNTVEAIETNRQMDLFEQLPPEIAVEGGRQTWVLMHHTDSARGEIRIELSRPSSIGNDGKITAWAERIILGSIPFDDELVEIYAPDGPDIDVDVRRKA